MRDVARAFFWREVVQQCANGRPQVINRARGGFSQQRLEFGEHLLNRVEVRTVGRQVQGRGFAVVAAEVRSLAGRSAAAAKEIKNLIDESVRNVESGSALASEAGSTMAEVMESSKRVTAIMAEIAAANREQSASIQQVNQSIEQMDAVTQQNAVMVGESNSASQALETETILLSRAISVFKL